MKSLKNLLLCVLTISTVSCSKYLDRQLENKPDASTGIDYTDISSMYSPVSGIYRSAAGAAPGLIHWMDFGVRSVRGDDYEKGSSASDQSTLTDIKTFKNDYASIKTFWGTNNSWQDYYGLIINCNNALIELDKYAANIPSGNANDIALNASYKGEVRFIRAFAHLLASRVFGDVPILTDNNNIATLGKSTVADVRTFIMTEMDTCISVMEDAAPNAAKHTGAVTKYSALLLKAKAAADLAGNDNASQYWDVVLECTNQIINSGKFSLYADFYQLFKIPGKLCNESLYEIQYTDFGTSTGTSIGPDAFWAFQGPSGDQRGSAVSGWGFMTPTQNIVDFLQSRNDSVRFKTTILYCGDPAFVGTTSFPDTYTETPSGDKVYGNTNNLKYFGGKAYLPTSQMTPGRTDYGSNNNVRVLRYADVLLLNAEAKVRKGQSGDAPFNLVRVRAKLSPIAGVTLDQIIDERRAEFACEWWGERYNDLIRTGQATSVLASNGFEAGDEYLPIPQTQIDLDENLGQ